MAADAQNIAVANAVELMLNRGGIVTLDGEMVSSFDAELIVDFAMQQVKHHFCGYTILRRDEHYVELLTVRRIH